MPDQEPASMLLDDQLCFALYSATHSIQRLYRPLLDSLNLTYPQYLVLLVLWEGDDITVSTIGDRLSLSSATLTPLLKRMDAAGLISRARSAQDERKVVISLTEAGSAIQEQVQHVTTDVTCAAVAAASDAQALLASLTALRTQLPKSL